VQKSILIVDDQPIIRSMLRLTLNQLGDFLIKEAANGREAYAVVQSSDIELIFCDINMPESDGLELLKLLSDDKFSGEIIIISGEDEALVRSAKSLLDSYQLTIREVLEKPLTLRKVRRCLTDKNSARSAAPNTDIAEISEELLARYIDEKRVVASFQAQYSLSTMQVVGFEALARIELENEVIYPAQFIPVAENSPLIMELTKVVVDSALTIFTEKGFHNKELTLSINLSSKVLEDNQFPKWLSERCRMFGVACSQIICELTETSIVNDPTLVHTSLLRLRMLDFKVSLDDFGTGYATLTQLHSLPLSELKIDRSFVSDLLENKNSLSVCVRSIALGKDFGLKVVAEGIEDEGTLLKLRELGCDIGQGYFLARPTDAKHVAVINKCECRIWACPQRGL